MSQTIESLLGPAGYYTRRGEDAVLLVHGLTGTPAEMRSLAKKLQQQGFSVMCPRLAGHCGSISELKKSRWQDWYRTVEQSFEALKAEHRQVYVAGLSMGALLALRLAAHKGDRVAGLGMLSSTFFYDGWNMPKYKRRLLLPLVIYSPLKLFMSWTETSPYGIKCERTRAQVQTVLENRDANASEQFGIFRTPAVTIHESMRLIQAARLALPQTHTPTMIVHALEDDMASIKNAQYVEKHIASQDIETFYVADTYHVLTLDRHKHQVAERLCNFFLQRLPAAAVAA